MSDHNTRPILVGIIEKQTQICSSLTSAKMYVSSCEVHGGLGSISADLASGALCFRWQSKDKIEMGGAQEERGLAPDCIS